MSSLIHRSKDDIIRRRTDRRDMMWRMEDEKEEGKLMAKSESGGLQGTDQLESKLNNSKGEGASFNGGIKTEMESKMGADLSDVKIHTDSNAHEMSEGINAKAFTHGQDIYFKQGNYDASSTEGKKLLAHELTHTQQQKNGVQRKIQRKEYHPKKVADDYFAGIEGYSFKILQERFGSDGSGPQNMKLQDLLSAIIYMNQDKTPQQVWDQILKDPTELRGYDAYFMITTDEQNLSKYSRTTSTLTPVTATTTDLTSVSAGTVDYALSKNFLIRKKKREEKRKEASDLATSHIHGTANKLQGIINESQQFKLDLEQKVQTLLSDMNSRLNSEGTLKEKTISEKIDLAKANAETAKKEIVRYYYGSLTVINHNTKVQIDKLDLYRQQTNEKISKLQKDQQAEIDKLYKEFEESVNGLLPGFTKTAQDEGRKRYESHTTGMFTTSLDEQKGRSAVKASQQAEGELNSLAVNTITNAYGTTKEKTKKGEEPLQNKKGYEDELKRTSTSFQLDIESIYLSTKDRLLGKAELDKQAAGILKDEYKSHVDEITLGTIQALSDALDLHYTQLDDFGAKQDAIINQFYVESVGKLTASSQSQIEQTKIQLETFSANQKGKKTPKLKKLQEEIALSESQLSPLVLQASGASKTQHENNLKALEALTALVYSEMDALSLKNTNAITTLMQNSDANFAAVQKSGIDAQLQLRVDHLNSILNDIDSAKEQMQIQVDGFYESNQFQLEDIKENLAQRLQEFQDKANEIIAGLDEKMDEAERKTDTAFYTGDLIREMNVKDFKSLSLKLYGTDDSYKTLKEIMGEGGYGNDYEVFLVDFKDGVVSWVVVNADNRIKALNDKLKVQGFTNGTQEYVETIIAFEKGFRLAASALTLRYVKDYELKLFNAETSLGDPKTRKDLFDSLDAFRKSVKEEGINEYAAWNMDRTTKSPDTESPNGSTDGRKVRTEAQEKEYQTYKTNYEKGMVQTRNDLKALYGRFPVLNDEDVDAWERMDKHAMGDAKDADALADIILAYVADRKKNAAAARLQIIEDEGTDEVYTMDKAMPSIMQSLGLDPKTFPGSIIQDKIDDKNTESLIWGIITAIFVIALTILSGPIGVAVGGTAFATIAGLTALTISVASAFTAIKDFERQNNLAGMNLSSEPSFIWVVLAVVGAALDIGPLLKSVKTIKALNIELINLDKVGTANLPAFKTFINGLIDTKQLDAQIGKVILNGVDSRLGYLKAVDEFNLMKTTGSLADPKLLGPLTKMAFFKIREGIATFEQYLTIVKRALGTETVSSEQLTLYKSAYKAGQESFETGVTKYGDEVLEITARTGDEVVSILPEGSLANLSPVTPSPSGFINKTKVSNGMTVDITNQPQLQTLVDDVVRNGDTGGGVTEEIQEIILNNEGFISLDGKVGSNQGFDYLGIKGSVDNPTEIVIGDGKPLGADGGIKLSSADVNTGLPVQLSDDWIENVAVRMRNEGLRLNDPEKVNIANMILNNPNIISKYVTAVNKTTGQINILKLGTY